MTLVVALFSSFLKHKEAESYLWTFPECPIRIRLNFRLIERLRSDCLAAGLTGSEIGGVLIGNRTSADGHVEITDAIPMPAEGEDHAEHFVIRSDAMKRVAERCSAVQRQIVGYYRSHSGQRACLRAEDLAFIEEWFKDPNSAFLVIRPHNGRASAGFFFRQNGSVFPEFTLMFPFSSEELKSREWASLVGGSSEPSWVRRFFVRATEGMVQVGTSGKWLLLYGLMALSLLFAIAATRGHISDSWLSSSAQPDSTRGLGLHVRRNGIHIAVTWDSSAPALASAKQGNLLIWDGTGQPFYLPLTPEDLRSGSASYASENSKVTFRLDVIGPAGNAKSESVVSIGRPAEDSQIARADAPASSSDWKSGSAAVGAAPKSWGSLPPELESSTPQPALTPPPRSIQARPVPRRVIKPLASVLEAGPVAQVRSDAAPLSNAPSSDVTPPEAVSAQQPKFPAEAKSLVDGDTVIEVQVTIDASGRVTAASPASSSGTAPKSLVDSAVRAAMGWRFKPAKRNGKPVPSEKLIRFLYRPSDH
jgi:TonB family protein